MSGDAAAAAAASSKACTPEHAKALELLARLEREAGRAASASLAVELRHAIGHLAQIASLRQAAFEDAVKERDTAMSERDALVSGGSADAHVPDFEVWFSRYSSARKGDEERARDAYVAGLAARSTAKRQPELAVWFDSMPESNGKKNWTVLLHRKDAAFWDDSITLERSEYYDRARYEADRARFLIGEIDKEPCIPDYDQNLMDRPPVVAVAAEGEASQ